MNQNQDQFFLKEALKLAKKGMGWTNPNPMVGAILVKNGKIIGKGYHKEVGFAHAEIEALKSSKESTKGATLYINLEPCSHFGRTPPCVDAIIKAKIARVICSTLDPSPKVNGEGIAKLKKAGIKVTVGILEKEARQLNEAFFTFHEKKRPFIVIKFAASLDGKIATKTGESKWITNEKARQFARKLRSHYQAILVGINTVLRDDPHLGLQDKVKRDPLRIILDSTLRISLNAQVLRDMNVLIVTTAKADQEKKRKLAEKGYNFIVFKERIQMQHLLVEELYKKGILSVLVEGGGETLGGFVDKKLLDKVYAFYAPIIIGGNNAISAVKGVGVKTILHAISLKTISYKRFGNNSLVTGYI